MIPWFAENASLDLAILRKWKRGPQAKGRRKCRLILTVFNVQMSNERVSTASYRYEVSPCLGFPIGSGQIRSRSDWPEIGEYKPPYKHLPQVSPRTSLPRTDGKTEARGNLL